MSRADKFETYYSILGVPPSASTEEICKAYRRASLAVHPDKGGDAAAFRRLSQAYDVLKDPALRKRYDKYGASLEPSSGDIIGSGAVGRLVPLALSALGAAASQFAWTVGVFSGPSWGLGCALSAGGSWFRSREMGGASSYNVAPAIIVGFLLGNAAGLVAGFGARGVVLLVKRRH